MYKLKPKRYYKIMWHRKNYKGAISYSSGYGSYFLGDGDDDKDGFKFRIRDIVCFSKLLRIMYEEM